MSFFQLLGARYHSGQVDLCLKKSNHEITHFYVTFKIKIYSCCVKGTIVTYFD